MQEIYYFRISLLLLSSSTKEDNSFIFLSIPLPHSFKLFAIILLAFPSEYSAVNISTDIALVPLTIADVSLRYM